MSIQKTHLLHSQRKARPLAMTRGLLDFLGALREVTESFEFDAVSKDHVIGLSACMGNLKKSHSALGLFSDPFIELSRKVAALLVTKKDAPYAMERVIAWWLQLSSILIVGLLESARIKKPSKETQNLDTGFRDELVLSLLFSSKYPKLLFQTMGKALQLEKGENELFTGVFELIVLFFASISYSEEPTVKEVLKPHLEETLRRLRHLEKEEMEFYLNLVEITLKSGNCAQLLETIKYPAESLKEDVSAMKDLFRRLKTACYVSSENNVNMIHMAG